MNDGAAGSAVHDQDKGKDLGLEPLAEIVAMCSIATKPNRLPEAPATAIKKVLGRPDLTLDDIKIIESINEAFAGSAPPGLDTTFGRKR